MRKKFRNFSKKGTAAILTTAMVAGSLTTGFIINSDNKAEAATVQLPSANYTYDFEGTLTDNGGKAVTSDGGKVEIVSDSDKNSKVLHISDGGTEVFGKNYYKLASDVFKGVTTSTGATVAMDVKVPSTIAKQWSVLFSTTGTDYNQWGLWKINANTVSDINAGTPWAYGGTAGETAINDGQWHNVTMTLTKDKLIVYLDGSEIHSAIPGGGDKTYATDGWTGLLNVLANNAFNVLGAGGFPAEGKTGDRDISDCYYDNVSIYANALSEDEVYYLATGKTMNNTDKTALNNAITSANAIKTELYTDATVKVFNEKLVAANTVKANGSAEQSEADTATKELVAAQKALVKLSVNLDDGVVLNSDMTSATSIVDVDANTVSFNEYTITPEGQL